MFRKSFLLAVLFGFSFFFFPAPQAKAMDPVTIALLAPVAIKAAQTAKPYLIRGLQTGAQGMILVGKDFMEIFYLPLGIGQVTLGAPFGMLKSGAKNCVIGGMAPFKMTFHLVMLPIYCTGFVAPR